jgi:alkylhydroperoxidase family enzyme
VVDAVLADPASAPIDAKLKATLGFLAKVTRSPSDVTAADAKAVLDAGVSRKAIQEALFVCAMFNLIDRLADAFGFAVPDEGAFRATAKMLVRFGYGL